MIFIVSSNNAASIRRSLGLQLKDAWAEILPGMPARNTIQPNDQIYLDISGLSPADLKKALGLLKRSGVLWGIIDPKGAAEDPASFVFEGACDYIGPALVKKGLNKKRFATVFSRALSKGADISGNAAQKAEAAARKKAHKLHIGKFGGWKTIRAGTTEPFLFLFASFSENTNLRSHVGETALNAVKNRVRDVLQQGLRDADALLWMETGDNSLFLVPPCLDNGRAAVEASLKMILSSRLIGIEKFSLPVPMEFTFALHYGKTTFQAPGKTGAVISESVNYIFHLGARKAEPGRLTVSGDVPEEAIPEGLLDLFNPAGVLEGIPIRHSRRFVYK